jgi:hypothetical protein
MQSAYLQNLCEKAASLAEDLGKRGPHSQHIARTLYELVLAVGSLQKDAADKALDIEGLRIERSQAVVENMRLRIRLADALALDLDETHGNIAIPSDEETVKGARRLSQALFDEMTKRLNLLFATLHKERQDEQLRKELDQLRNWKQLHVGDVIRLQNQLDAAKEIEGMQP